MNPLSFQFVTTVRLGVKSLMLHKLRSALTMLGIIFGVCSVIAMLAIGEGASYEAQEAIKKLGSDNIILRSIKPPEDSKQAGLGRGTGYKYEIRSKVRGAIFLKADPCARYAEPPPATASPATAAAAAWASMRWLTGGIQPHSVRLATATRRQSNLFPYACQGNPAEPIPSSLR